jgi:predicted Zn-dependent protease
MTTPLDIAVRLVELVGDRAEAEAAVRASTGALTRFANSFIHQNVAEEHLGISLRVAVDGRVAGRSANRSDPETLEEIVEDALEIAALQPVDPQWPGLADRADVPQVDHYDEATAAADPDARADAVADFVAAGGGLSAAGYCETAAVETACANSLGQRLSGRTTRATLDGIHQTGESAGSAHQTSGRFSDLDGTAAGSLAAERARSGMGAADIQPGRYEVVLAPEAVATIGIFLAVYGFNGKQVAEGQSFVDLGAQQFDPAISIWDDAVGPGSLGLGFDTEGTPTPVLGLVRDGVTIGMAHDRRTARRLGGESTGHGAPASPAWGPIVGDMVIGGGSAPPEELIAGVERGLYVATFNYCRVLEPKSQLVTGLTRNGTFLIERGEVTGAVSNLRFTQSFVEALAPGAVLGVGNDLRYADSEFGTGLVRAPSLRLASWNFTGGAAG